LKEESLISVIVPVYKVEQFLERCVISVLCQSYSHFELILVDDGSPDNCPVLCDQWALKDDRIRVIHKENGGASSARNTGLRIAKGDYICFIDSDDWIQQNMFADLLDLALRNQADMVICQRVSGTPHRNVQIKEWNQDDLFNHFFRVHGERDTHGIWGRLIKRDILKDYSFIEGRMNEDVETSYFLATKCRKAVFTSGEYYNYFLNQSGVTRSAFSLKKMDLIYIWDCVMENVLQNYPQYIKVCEMNCKRAKFTLLSQMYLNGYDKKNLALRKIRKNLKKDVRKSYFDLIKWKMPLNRKILLTMVII